MKWPKLDKLPLILLRLGCGSQGSSPRDAELDAGVVSMRVVRREPLVMPDLGLGKTSLVASVWFVAKGQEVTAGEPLLEVMATGVVVDLAAPFSGRLVEKRVLEDDLLQIGMVLGFLERDLPSRNSSSVRSPAVDG